MHAADSTCYIYWAIYIIKIISLINTSSNNIYIHTYIWGWGHAFCIVLRLIQTSECYAILMATVRQLVEWFKSIDIEQHCQVFLFVYTFL